MEQDLRQGENKFNLIECELSLLTPEILIRRDGRKISFFVCLHGPRGLSKNEVKIGKSKRVYTGRREEQMFFIIIIILSSALQAFAFI